ncbi:hypothetical protein ACOMHN_031673 [Nucella lapillus]
MLRGNFVLNVQDIRIAKQRVCRAQEQGWLPASPAALSVHSNPYPLIPRGEDWPLCQQVRSAGVIKCQAGWSGFLNCENASALACGKKVARARRGRSEIGTVL